MSKLVWSNLNARYESGLDRGVFYPEEGPGVAWNGLVSVDDSFVGGEIEPLYLDGVLFHHMPSSRNYQATITAFSAPDEFAPSNGEIAIRDGFILTRQPRKRFGFSYRVMVGDDLGYKIHLVYNALATPTTRGYKTRSNSPSPSNPVWQIDAVPVESEAPRPTAHFVLDSTKIDEDQMEAIEGLLYGEKTRSPYLPSIKQITAIITNWDPKIVVPDYVAGLSPLVSGMGDVVESDVDGIYISLPNGRLAETSVRGLYQLTE